MPEETAESPQKTQKTENSTHKKTPPKKQPKKTQKTHENNAQKTTPQKNTNTKKTI